MTITLLMIINLIFILHLLIIYKSSFPYYLYFAIILCIIYHYLRIIYTSLMTENINPYNEIAKFDRLLRLFNCYKHLDDSDAA